jgi:hypothetical protein
VRPSGENASDASVSVVDSPKSLAVTIGLPTRHRALRAQSRGCPSDRSRMRIDRPRRPCGVELFTRRREHRATRAAVGV